MNYNQGKNNPNYKDGRTNKKYYCKDCGIEISSYRYVRCIKCNRRFLKGKPTGGKNIKNIRFGRLIAIEPTHKRKGSNIIWKCKCDCGCYKEVPINYLTLGYTKSCGCLQKEQNLKKGKHHQSFKHGKSRTKLYQRLKRLSLYGLTRKDYKNLLNKQNNKCAICHISQSNLTKRLCIDHDHKTGKVRGLLCCQCNSTLGRFEKYYKQINNYLKKSNV